MTRPFKNNGLSYADLAPISVLDVETAYCKPLNAGFILPAIRGGECLKVEQSGHRDYPETTLCLAALWFGPSKLDHLVKHYTVRGGVSWKAESATARNSNGRPCGGQLAIVFRFPVILIAVAGHNDFNAPVGVIGVHKTLAVQSLAYQPGEIQFQHQ